MSPLLYLQLMRFKNGVKRSFKTPMRAAMTVFVAGYLVFSVLAMLHARGAKAGPPSPALALHLEDPVALFTLFHSLLLLLVLPPPKYLFTILTEADVANLYPIPFRRWRVFRFFMFSRSFAVYLLVVAVGALYASMALRVLIPGLVPSNDHSNGMWGTLIYILVMVVVICGMLFWRLLADVYREFKRIPANAFGVGAFAAIGFVVGVIAYRMNGAVSAGEYAVLGLLASPNLFPLSIVLAPFRFLAELFLQRADFSRPFALAGLAFWSVWTYAGYHLLRRQEHSLYEYAARLGTVRAEMVARMRSPAAAFKHRTAGGKPTAPLPWFLRTLRPRRAGAIFWRDLVITWRSYGLVIKWLCYFFVLAVIAGWFAATHFHAVLSPEKVWVVSALLLSLPIFPLSMLSLSGMAEVLRTSDIQKPLPIGNLQTVGMHTLQWTVVICSVIVPPSLIGAILFHPYWHIILFVLALACSFVHIFCSTGFIIALFNPDQHDPLQRFYSAFFGFFSMLGGSLPGAFVLIICFVFHSPLWLTMILVVGVNAGIAVLLQHLSARKYHNFVFTE